jgi:hypothetical protein
LYESEQNLRRIRVRKAEYVLPTEVPLQLEKDEERCVERITTLAQELRAAEAKRRPEPGENAPGLAQPVEDERGDQEASRGSRRWWRVAGVAAGVAVMLVVLVGSGVVLGLRIRSESVREDQTPAIALVGMSYMVDHWDPRRVDLSRAAEGGIPVEAGRLLEIVDVLLSVPDDAPDYVANIEVYENPELTALVGAGADFPLTKGVRRVKLIKPTKYATKPDTNPKENDVWKVPPGWIDNTLRVAVVVYRRGQPRPVHIAITEVLLKPGGDAWFIDPPNATLASVAYSVNEGPIKIVDLREASQKGLDVQVNDTLTIQEIWYTSNAGGGVLHAEAYLTADDFHTETYRSTGGTLAEKGTRPLNGIAGLRWKVPPDLDVLVLSLVRDDGIVLDRLVAKLNGAKGSKGLVPQ